MSSWIEAVVNRGTDGQIEWIMQRAALNGRAGSGGPKAWRTPLTFSHTHTHTQDGLCLYVCVCVCQRDKMIEKIVNICIL